MILAFDTAGPVAGVALWVEGSVSTRIERVTRGAERRLIPWAAELVAEAGGTMASIRGVGCADGPGAFTGLRVGLATAAGLALALRVPLWTACSLDHRAARVGSVPALIALLDARKSRVYAAAYQHGDRVHGPADVAPELALGWMDAPFQAVGEGAVVYRELVEGAGGVVVDEAGHPSVDTLARHTAAAIDQGLGGDPRRVSPRYLRAPDARPPKR